MPHAAHSHEIRIVLGKPLSLKAEVQTREGSPTIALVYSVEAILPETGMTPLGEDLVRVVHKINSLLSAQKNMLAQIGALQGQNAELQQQLDAARQQLLAAPTGIPTDAETDQALSDLNSLAESIPDEPAAEVTA